MREHCRCGAEVNPWEAAQCVACREWVCGRCRFGVGADEYHTGCIDRETRRIVAGYGQVRQWTRATSTQEGVR